MLNIINHQKNVNQNHSDTTSHPLGWLQFLKTLKITRVGKDLDKLEPSYIVGRNVK